ncbi:hypothetical protein CISIN_1g0095932mg, partial [Citrus sinensis]
MNRISLTIYLAVFWLLTESSGAETVMFSTKLIHRFSEEVKALGVSKNRNATSWPAKKSFEYYQVLLSSDVQKQKMKTGPQFQMLFPSQGSKTMSLGNDFGCDLLWIPCDCVRCAPLSASYYNSL